MGKKLKKPGLVQNILFVVNFLLFIVGCASITSGLIMKNPERFKKYMNKAFQELNLQVPQELMKIISLIVQNGSARLAGVFIVTGGIVAVVSFAGCVGACCSKTLLKFYRWVLIFVMLIVIFVFQVGLKNNLGKMPQILSVMFARYFAHFNEPMAQKLIHITQHSGRCCGVLGPDSWKDNPQWNENIQGRPGLGSNPVPTSCCRSKHFAPGCGLGNNETYVDKNVQVLDKLGVKQAQLNKWKDQYKQEIIKNDALDFEDFLPNDEKFDDQAYNVFENLSNFDIYDQFKQAQLNGTFTGNFTTFYDTHSENGLEFARASQEGRFVAVDQDEIDGFADEQIIFHEGCAVRYGVMIARLRPKIDTYTIMAAIPFLLAIAMCIKVERYFEKKADLD